MLWNSGVQQHNVTVENVNVTILLWYTRCGSLREMQTKHPKSARGRQHGFHVEEVHRLDWMEFKLIVKSNRFSLLTRIGER